MRPVNIFAYVCCGDVCRAYDLHAVAAVNNGRADGVEGMWMICGKGCALLRISESCPREEGANRRWRMGDYAAK